jgi:hypothetical protein
MFAAVTRLVDITGVKGGKVSNLLRGYTETSSFHNRATVNFILGNVNKI